ncbi:hydrogenase maturation nickel metallochaperone HypA [Thauera sinica]|uniref:Hydrogenase maturation factor HypA n=1 Tax=Thauera sinica TaxID=2665146 RepID=A0ABW1ARI7_9RHOO|nr:hydrogenase maturation nickel metallochaperone HypA [Thauera sp. K11]ATE62828.1 hydrogenase maturation nickel metallochaperone HypA [Thauera sp. K11]
MHELSLAESAVGLIEDAARRERFTRVRVVRMEIGALSCVEAEALRFAFESASLGTCAEGARLDIVAVPGEGECAACGIRAAMETLYDLCPRCESRPLRVLRGTELRVRDLDVE